MQGKAVGLLLVVLAFCWKAAGPVGVFSSTGQVTHMVVAVARAKATAGAPTKPKGVTVSDNGRAVELTTKGLCMV